MLGVMLQKMWQKKWMNLSLLLGCILLIATAVSFPLYQKGAYDRMLNDEFLRHIASEGTYPMVIKMSANCDRDKKGTLKKIEDFSKDIYTQMDVPEYMTVEFISVFRSAVTSDIKREDAEDMNLSLSMMSDLSDHGKIINGQFYSESGIDDEGCIEAVVSQATFVQRGLLLGETLSFDKLKTASGDDIRIKIVGVFTADRDEKFYFQEDPEKMFDVCFINPDLFRESFLGDASSKYNISIAVYDLIDYEKVTADMVDRINSVTDHLCNESAYKSVIKDPDYIGILGDYALKKVRISATLLILQIPVLVLLSAFLLMISGQMYEMEKNEISVIKSRGSSRGQILLLYIYQGLFLTILGALLGIPLGGFFARALGSTRNFLEFDIHSSLNITYTKEVFLYAAIAMVITLLSISVPAIKHSRVSIVNLKQQKAVNKRSLWEILYIDVIFIGVAMYGYYTFSKRLKDISTTVLSGNSLDPLLYVSSSLFIVGMGLLFLRLQPYIVNGIFFLLKRTCGPASYISFTENIRNGRKMQLIMLFLIMTISLGMFHATVARTILENAVENTDYSDGADVVLMENWPAVIDSSGVPTGQYMEPDYGKYASMDFASSYTRVLNDDKAYIGKGKTGRISVSVMGIHTKEFGQITGLAPNLNEKQYYEYLNELASSENGALLSRAFESKLDYKIGDEIVFNNAEGKSISLKVVDFVDYFPTYIPTITEVDPDGQASVRENYLIVAQYSYLKKQWGLRPYEIWIDLNDDADDSAVYDFVTEHDLKLKKYTNKTDDIEDTMTDPLLQGTNGVLTMGFVVTLVLCAVGYLIYFILSIKERELIFGVLRACGLHRREIVYMLIYEQIFTGLFSVLAGIGIGRLSSTMFVPILQTSYATSDQVLPMKLITHAADMYRLYGIVLSVLLACVFILIVLLFRMNVTKALKLGEE